MSDDKFTVCEHPSYQSFRSSMEAALRRVMEQREEVIEAFIAKYGFEPERFVQVEQLMPNGLREWSVRRRTDEQMAELSARGALL